jgi:hypothetical protein
VGIHKEGRRKKVKERIMGRKYLVERMKERKEGGGEASTIG